MRLSKTNKKEVKYLRLRENVVKWGGLIIAVLSLIYSFFHKH